MDFVFYLIRLGLAAAIVLGIRWIWMRHANQILVPIAKRIKKIVGLFENRKGMVVLSNDNLLDLQDDINLAIVEMNHLFGKGNTYSQTLINARKKASLRHPNGYTPAEVEILGEAVNAAAHDRGTIYADEVSRLAKYRTSLVWFTVMLAVERILYGFYNLDSYRVLWRTWIQILSGS